MTCRSDRKLVALLAAGLLAGGPLAAAPGDDALERARAAIEAGDGIAAEMAARQALDGGAEPVEVAAYLGEAELLQGDLRDAREWLGEGEFDAATRTRGLHALARLEIAEEDFEAAFRAFDRLLQADGASAPAWVDIGRLRYSVGDHRGALEAAREAIRLGPKNPRALEFVAQLVRDSSGLRAALPLYRQALEQSPEDIGLLGQYAATLGDAGQHQQMLQVARRMAKIAPQDPQAYYLQAVIAARAGMDDLARRLMWRAAGHYDERPAGLLLTGTLEYRAGNYALAVEEFDRLVRLLPDSSTARLLLGRALLGNGEANEAIARLEPFARRTDASPYLLMLMARAHEQMGRRDLAAAYLDSAAWPAPGFAEEGPILPLPAEGPELRLPQPVAELRRLLGNGQLAEAREMAGQLIQSAPGSADFQLLAGDVELLAGAPDRALDFYGQVALVRTTWPLARRIAMAHSLIGDDAGARRVLSRYLAANPRDAQAAALLGRMQRDTGELTRAAVLMRYACSLGAGGEDPVLLADLAAIETTLGNPELAAELGRAAFALQRGNRHLAAVLAQIAAAGDAPQESVGALLAKARGTGDPALAAAH